MALVTTSLRDVGLTPMGPSWAARLTFTPEDVSTRGGYLQPTQPVSVMTGPDGVVSVELVASLETNPYVPYRLTIEWLDPGGRVTAPDRPPWRIVVPPEGGRLADMIALVTPQRIVTKGDKGDHGDMAQQKAIDELTAKNTAQDVRLDSEEAKSRAQAELLSIQGQTIETNRVKARLYTDQKTHAVELRIDTSNVALDTDGAPFFHIGSTTTKVLQDSDGTPYYTPV